MNNRNQFEYNNPMNNHNQFAFRNPMNNHIQFYYNNPMNNHNQFDYNNPMNNHNQFDYNSPMNNRNQLYYNNQIDNHNPKNDYSHNDVSQKQIKSNISLSNIKKNKSEILDRISICNSCKISPIKGPSYKKTETGNDFLCKDCWLKYIDKNKHSNSKENTIVFELISNKIDEENQFLETFFDKILNKNTKDNSSVEEEKQNIHNDILKKQNFISEEKPVDEIDLNVTCLEDLIELSKLYNSEDFPNKNYSVNIKGIYDMVPSLIELQSLVGLNDVKQKIIDQIIFFSQNLHNNYVEPKKENTQTNPISQFLNIENKKSVPNKEFNKFESCLKDDDQLDMLHTVIEGPPGVGKTIFGKILSRIYLSLGITYKDKFKIVSRTDLVGEYLGHTAIKTQKVIDECLGGVLFIDEAYQLGNGNNKKIDSYSKECIDTLNQNLSEKKGQFICIIAGYKKELEENFFSVNPGLKRRFSFKYTIESYDWKELTNILIYKIPKIKWKIDDETKTKLIETEFLKDKMEQFPHFGGDIETLLLNIKIEHGKRVFGKKIQYHKNINFKDVEEGYKRFLENRKIQKQMVPFGMYT